MRQNTVGDTLLAKDQYSYYVKIFCNLFKLKSIKHRFIRDQITISRAARKICLHSVPSFKKWDDYNVDEQLRHHSFNNS